MNIKEWKAIHGRLARIHEKLEPGYDTNFARYYIASAMAQVDFEVAQIEKRRSKEGV